MLSSYVPSATCRGGEVIVVSIRDLSTRGVGGQPHAPAALLPEKGPCIHCTGGWIGLDGYGKCRLPTGIRIPDRPAHNESLYQLSYPIRNLPTFKTTFHYKKIFFGFETHLVGINVSETITLLCHRIRHNGDGTVVRNVMFLQPF
jgi:hypothetical protein